MFVCPRKSIFNLFYYRCVNIPIVQNTIIDILRFSKSNRKPSERTIDDTDYMRWWTYHQQRNEVSPLRVWLGLVGAPNTLCVFDTLPASSAKFYLSFEPRKWGRAMFHVSNISEGGEEQRRMESTRAAGRNFAGNWFYLLLFIYLRHSGPSILVLWRLSLGVKGQTSDGHQKGVKLCLFSPPAAGCSQTCRRVTLSVAVVVATVTLVACVCVLVPGEWKRTEVDMR